MPRRIKIFHQVSTTYSNHRILGCISEGDVTYQGGVKMSDNRKKVAHFVE